MLKRDGMMRKALIIAPLRPMYSTWPSEVYKWDEFNDFTYTIIHGPEKEARLREDVDLYFINPEGVKWLLAQPNLPAWDTLIVDESTKFKDPSTQRFKALKKAVSKFRRRWILTGTPVPNGLMDLFGQLYILDRGRSLGEYITHFRAEFFMKPGWSPWGWVPQPGAFEKAVERISPLILQLSTEDYLKMPELMYIDIPVELPKEVKKTYRQVENDFLAAIEDEAIVAANAAAAGTKCRQIANGAVYVGEGDDRMVIPMHDAKLDALEDLLEELNGHPVLLLYEFRHDRERICTRFPHAVDLRSSDIAKTVEAFNHGDIPLLIGHPASMGHGLNLQGSCHHVIWYGITWNLEYYDQAIARVYRQGQSHAIVYCYHLKALGTKDEDVLEVLTQKDRTQQDLLHAITQYRRDNLGE